MKTIFLKFTFGEHNTWYIAPKIIVLGFFLLLNICKYKYHKLSIITTPLKIMKDLCFKIISHDHVEYY